MNRGSDCRKQPGAGRPSNGRGARGQSLVEFALVFPIFTVILFGIIEFAFVFNATLAVQYSTRDAALAGAEAGRQTGADCVILKAVDNAIGALTSSDRVQTVEIFKVDSAGTATGPSTVYRRDASSNPAPCASIDGSTVHYVLTSNTYAETSRCNVLGGCGGGSTTVDNVAIRVTYTHRWVTPLPNFIGGGPGGITFARQSVMRMEPVL